MAQKQMHLPHLFVPTAQVTVNLLEDFSRPKAEMPTLTFYQRNTK